MFSERQYLRATDNEMVRHTDINELKCLHQTLRYGLICLAGRGVAGCLLYTNLYLIVFIMKFFQRI